VVFLYQPPDWQAQLYVFNAKLSPESRKPKVKAIFFTGCKTTAFCCGHSVVQWCNFGAIDSDFD